ncbi:MAG: cyclic nucleotide-binding domain-containing protein [Proteobacteria bacterium]|nr:cyclic nucleotide-binding domain-containing protein [Pseudomonadota bacterium]
MPQNRTSELLWFLGRFRKDRLDALKYAALLIGLTAMTAMTVPAARTIWLAAALWGCWGLFAAELAFKTWRSVHVGHASPYLGSPALWGDVVGVAPVPVALAAGVPPEKAWLFAALWILKLASVVPGLSLLGRIIRLEARPLASVFVIFVIVLLLSGVALHLVEGPGQPDKFGTLPLSLWWAVTTLTTTGYGDAVPETVIGRSIAGLVMICGLGVFGLWTGILATGFASEHRRREFIRNYELVTRVPFLRSLDAAGVIELTRMLRRQDLAERSVVVRRGRAGDCMFFIADGEVEVQVEPEPIRLAAGSFFGEFALLDGSPRTATVMTTRPTTLLILDVTDFRAFTAQHPELAKELEAEAARRRSSVKDAGHIGKGANAAQ